MLVRLLGQRKESEFTAFCLLDNSQNMLNSSMSVFHQVHNILSQGWAALHGSRPTDRRGRLSAVRSINKFSMQFSCPNSQESLIMFIFSPYVSLLNGHFEVILDEINHQKVFIDRQHFFFNRYISHKQSPVREIGCGLLPGIEIKAVS